MLEVERVYRAYNAAENAHDVVATTSLVALDLEVAINGRSRIASGDEDAIANARLFASFPDYRREIVEVIAEGDRAAIRWRMVGSPTPGSGLAPLDLHGCSVVEVRDGCLARAYLYVDEGSLAAVLPGSDN
jgi:predicted ester cyclase